MPAPKPDKRRSLTVQFVRNATRPGRTYDRSRSGFHLWVKPDGTKYYVQRITINGKQRDIGLGNAIDVSLADAREEAASNKRIVRGGRDPLSEKHQRPQSTTFRDAVDEYLAAKTAEFQNEKHRKQWRATLEAHAMPGLGNMNVGAIGSDDILRVLQPIWTEKTETASRLRGRIEKVLDWATVKQLRSGDNPARWKGNLSEVLPAPSKIAKPAHFPALRLADARRWWAALKAREGSAARSLQFACLTAARSGEVRGMTWAEVDLDEALWVVPAERMKAGREHRVPLPPAAVAILEAIPRMKGSPYVFFAPRGGQLSDMSISAVMRRMQEAEKKIGRKGFVDSQSGRPAVPHGLRSTFRDWAAEQGYDHVMAEMALAHSVGSTVERAYRRTDLIRRRRDMLTDWAAFLDGEAENESPDGSESP